MHGCASFEEPFESNDLGHGCAYCEWQLAAGAFACLPIYQWDRHPVPSPDPRWPKQMEFAISNTCNLQCVMCNGRLSSAIRARREKLPPLPDPYSPAFFEELRAYLPHLVGARFLGGEPFLQAHCYRIWNMLIEDHIDLPCHITTNGTVYNARVERVLDNLPMAIAVSVDGFSKGATVERIRVNACYEEIQENLRRFRAYTVGRGTSFGLTFCLMRQNWHELGDFCLFADSLSCRVFVNQVRDPAEYSLYTLPTTALMRVVSAMEAQAVSLLPNLKKNRGVWTDQLEGLARCVSGRVKVPGCVRRRG